jgi:hypothetical protein
MPEEMPGKKCFWPAHLKQLSVRASANPWDFQKGTLGLPEAWKHTKEMSGKNASMQHISTQLSVRAPC